MTRTKYGRVSPNPLVGRRGSKVGKRRLTFGKKLGIALFIITILGMCVALGMFGLFSTPTNGQCCPPAPAPVEPITKEVIVEKTVVRTVLVEPQCADHEFEVGIQMFGPEPMFLGANIDWRPELGKVRGIWIDGGIGLSGAVIENQPMFGVNGKLGLAFANPGPFFDVAQFIWFPRWTDNSCYYEEIGVRLPIYEAPIGQVSALVYIGGEMFVTNSLGYLEGNALLVGGAARICRHDFSANFQVELKVGHQTRDCEDQGLTLGLGIKLFFWF